MAGILAAIKLREDDVGEVVIFEKGHSYGGTWRENHYPGVACDVPSHLYSYSFAPNPDWSHRFSPGPEIQAYFGRVAHEHGLEPITRFGEEVVSCRWEDGCWHLQTRSGDAKSFDLVIAATGVLVAPRMLYCADPPSDSCAAACGSWPSDASAGAFAAGLALQPASAAAIIRPKVVVRIFNMGVVPRFF